MLVARFTARYQTPDEPRAEEPHSTRRGQGRLEWPAERERDVADDLAPIVVALAHDMDELLHAVQRHETHLTSPLHVERAVGVL